MFSRRLLCNRLQNRIYKKPLRMGTGCHCSTDLRHSQCSCFKSCRVWDISCLPQHIVQMESGPLISCVVA